MSQYGTTGNDLLSGTSGGIHGYAGNDTITATAQDGTGQIHIWGGPYNDMISLDFSGNISGFSHGHHARGDDDGDAVRGDDSFDFINTDNVANGDVIVGRIEDFDASRDTITVDGTTLDMTDLPSNVSIVEYNGDHNDAGSSPQQWLLINTDTGGYIFYALEGARVDMNGNGGSNGYSLESHFISSPPNFRSLPQVAFIDQINVIPDGYAPLGGIEINDHDDTIADVLSFVLGTGSGDLIAAGLNDDFVSAGGGDDRVWGGSGNDTLLGGGGHDSMEGGTGNDSLVGGDGDDGLKGQQGDDTLDGGAGDDRLPGEDGDDVIYGGAGNDAIGGGWGNDLMIGGTGDDNGGAGPGNDTIHGEEGNDRFNAGPGNDLLYGGTGDDTFGGSYGQDTMYGDDGDDYFAGGDGDDSIFGGAGDDTIISGPGEDRVTGGSGADQFVFNHLLGSGTTEITDFLPGVDDLALRGHPGIDGLSGLNPTDLSGGVLLAYGNHTIILEGVSASELSNGDLLFA